MSYVILSVNAGSSSLKTSLFEVDASQTPNQLKRLASAEISSINQPPTTFKYVDNNDKRSTDTLSSDISSHKAAFSHILKSYFEDSTIPKITSAESIKYACHRIVHGGSFTRAEHINSNNLHKIEELSDLAPLHNASAITLIHACQEGLPSTTNIACFDSAFHSTLPAEVRTYMINPEIARQRSLRKYGFHGLSYAYITRAVANHLKKPVDQTNVIALHLGSGASACAIKGGKSVDTSMGLTPVSGLPGSTRSGDVDPSLIFHYASASADAEKEGNVADLSPASTQDLHITRAEEILNKESGWKALAGTSNFAELTDPPKDSEANKENMKLALDIFIDRVIGFVGSYFVKLGGEVDALVFAGGVGEKSVMLRKTVVEKCACLGFEIDASKNENMGESEDGVVDVGAEGAKAGVLVCETDEDYQMAVEVMEGVKDGSGF